MTMPLPWPSPAEVVGLPVDQLAMRLLWKLADAGSGHIHLRASFITEQANNVEIAERRRTTSGMMAVRGEDSLASHADYARAWAEAWDWLIAEGLLCRDVLPRRGGPPHPDAYFVTRRGFDIALRGVDALTLVGAQRQLATELHPHLEQRLRPLVAAGAFEQAAFDALREVEVLVFRLAGGPRDKSGGRLTTAKLMREAFSPNNGPLTDPQADPGEQVGVMELFAGAFGAVRNPLGHQQVRWSDPTEAAEFVLLADLLVRQLDRIA